MPLKMLVVGATWPLSTFLARLFKGLAESDVEVTLACSDEPDDAWLKHPQLGWLPTPRWSGSASRRLLRFGRLAATAILHAPDDVRRLAAQTPGAGGPTSHLRRWYRLLPFAGTRWDVVYFPWNTAAIRYLPLFEIARAAVISCRGAQISIAPVNPDRADIKDGLQRTFERATMVHCVSEDIKRTALRYGLLSEKARVIRPAVDAEFFRGNGHGERNNDELRIVTTGSLIWRKGYEYQLLAIRSLLDEGFRVRAEIIGDGDERERVVYTIRDLGLEQNVRLLGKMNPEGVRERLRRADVFVLSSLSEGISNAVLEAMSCGLPVVTTDCGGMREAISDGTEGFVVPVRDPGAMASALKGLGSSPAQRRAMGAAGRRRIESDFTLAGQVDNFLKLCLDALAASSRVAMTHV